MIKSPLLADKIFVFSRVADNVKSLFEYSITLVEPVKSLNVDTGTKNPIECLLYKSKFSKLCG